MKVGQIVKFKNSDGTLNGGTITGFNKNSNGSDMVLLNTLDNQNIMISIDKCINIKHQITGKQSKTFIDKVKKEIELHNNGIQENPNFKKKQEEIQLWINKYNEKIKEIENLNYEKNQLINENNELIEINRKKITLIEELQKDLENYKDNKKRQTILEYTILNLQKAIIAGCIDTKEQISILCETISDILELK